MEVSETKVTLKGVGFYIHNTMHEKAGAIIIGPFFFMLHVYSECLPHAHNATTQCGICT